MFFSNENVLIVTFWLLEMIINHFTSLQFMVESNHSDARIATIRQPGKSDQPNTSLCMGMYHISALIASIGRHGNMIFYSISLAHTTTSRPTNALIVTTGRVANHIYLDIY
eukprot:TRINITY_DN12431_c0_g1::TRINITY_DN12431_c0_g1_i1::g.15077::m.15077 TRINITY_DN12431_c0_g1::TRINITY_DN12431_c0_g1_i1::g.15077  ORF type:complete len:111 (+),score=0.89 TRINITY_DN12431_c0_g1_i1:104-436(+)